GILRLRLILLQPRDRGGAMSHEQTARLEPACFLSCFLRQATERLECIEHRRIEASTWPPGNIARPMPSRAGAQPITFDQNDAAQLSLRQMPGDAAAHNATANNHDPPHDHASPPWPSRQ